MFLKHLINLLILIQFLYTHTISAAFIRFNVATTPMLSNSGALPYTTKATLFRHNNTIVTPITRRNSFDFRSVRPGSYLFTVQCRDFTFPPLRVDVVSTEAGKETVQAWQTFWGNEWGNKGEQHAIGECDPKSETPVRVDIRPDRPKDYYIVKEGFSPLQFLKNPMILMALFSLVLIVGMPMLMDSMDEETRAEFEELQKSSPVSQATNSALNFQNFDLASWMAGKSTGSSDDASSKTDVSNRDKGGSRS